MPLTQYIFLQINDKLFVFQQKQQTIIPLPYKGEEYVDIEVDDDFWEEFIEDFIQRQNISTQSFVSILYNNRDLVFGLQQQIQESEELKENDFFNWSNAFLPDLIQQKIKCSGVQIIQKRFGKNTLRDENRKKQQAEIKSLQQQNESLKKQVAGLEKKLATIQQQENNAITQIPQNPEGPQPINNGYKWGYSYYRKKNKWPTKLQHLYKMGLLHFYDSRESWFLKSTTKDRFHLISPDPNNNVTNIFLQQRSQSDWILYPVDKYGYFDTIRFNGGILQQIEFSPKTNMAYFSYSMDLEDAYRETSTKRAALQVGLFELNVDNPLLWNHGTKKIILQQLRVADLKELANHCRVTVSPKSKQNLIDELSKLPRSTLYKAIVFCGFEGGIIKKVQ